MYLQFFEKYSNNKILNFMKILPVAATDGRTDTTKLVAFHKFENAPKMTHASKTEALWKKMLCCQALTFGNHYTFRFLTL